MTGSLVRYEAARIALREAKSVDEAKDIRDKADAVRAYARQANDTEMVSWASEIKLRAMRRMGELLKEGQKTGNIARPGEPIPLSVPTTLTKLGVSRDISSLSQKIAAVPDDEFEAHLEELRGQHKEVTVAGVAKLVHIAHVGHNSGDNEWYTPQKYVEAAREVMGGIDLDPASSIEANKIIKAKQIFTIDDDGLSKEWQGRIWMNPPYSGDLVGKFVMKLCDTNVDEFIILVNNATETEWFQSLATRCDYVCFPRGRIRYWKPGKDTLSPLQGQAMFYMGNNRDKFVSVFREMGVICEFI